jgi:hypothetical protein
MDTGVGVDEVTAVDVREPGRRAVDDATATGVDDVGAPDAPGERSVYRGSATLVTGS